MGEYADEFFTAFTKNAIYSAVQADYAKYNFVFSKSLMFQEIDRDAVCPAGTYKVALVVGVTDNGELDYHWYRQDSDGLWSHKPGKNEVKRVDNSGDLIVDPETADRGFYTNFLGYYAVSPWNNYYSASSSSNISPNYESMLIDSINCYLINNKIYKGIRCYK